MRCVRLGERILATEFTEVTGKGGGVFTVRGFYLEAFVVFADSLALVNRPLAQTSNVSHHKLRRRVVCHGTHNATASGRFGILRVTLGTSVFICVQSVAKKVTAINVFGSAALRLFLASQFLNRLVQSL